MNITPSSCKGSRLNSASKNSDHPLVRHPGLYRAQLSCKIGREVLEGKTQCPDGVKSIEWAMFNLLHAVEEIATAMMPNVGGEP